jgi:hypothetical protein
MRFTLVFVVLVAALAVAMPASAKVRKLEANLSGKNEKPAADPDGSGKAEVRLDRAKKRVCYEIRVKKISGVMMAHIHAGNKNVAAGPIKVVFFQNSPSGSKFEGCAKNVSRSLISKILKHPSRYYVNVHTMDFPGGAIRGQLHKPS